MINTNPDPISGIITPPQRQILVNKNGLTKCQSVVISDFYASNTFLPS